MSNTVARLVVIVLCVVALSACIGVAIMTVERRGLTPRSVLTIAAVLVIGVVAVWAIAATVGDPRADAATHVGPPYAGEAGSVGPVAPVRATAGVASNGTCDPACQLAWLGRQGGAAN